MTVSMVSCDGGLDLLEIGKSLKRVVSPRSQCGFCEGHNGKFVEAGEAMIYDRTGKHAAIVFQFLCSSCGACSGTISCSLAAAPGQKPRQVVSKFTNEASTFLLNRKAHECRDQAVGYTTMLFESFTNDAATIKTFGGFTTAYECTNDVALNENTFRDAYLG